jgi:hypothetical protein
MTESSAFQGPRERNLGRVGAPWAALTAALLASGAWLGGITHAPGLEAGNRDANRIDSDSDGVPDEQELVLGTSPDHADTDGDTYTDLEELSRKSNPLDAQSVPDADALGLGQYAIAEEDIITLTTAMFVEDGILSGLNFDLGIILDGEVILLSTKTYSGATSAYFYASQLDPANRMIVLEMRIPELLLQQMGKFDLFARVRDTGPLHRATQVDITELVDFSGTTMRLETAPSGMQGGGVVYRPLTGDGSIPATWTSGQICHQSTTPVGMNGASVIYEVQDADCASFDTYCSPGDCAATAGQPLERPDPGVLLGG